MSGSFARDPPAVRAEAWTRIPIHGLFAGSLPHYQRSSGRRCACARSPYGLDTQSRGPVPVSQLLLADQRACARADHDRRTP